jgi:L-amino acid N-acyltransferase YncA
MAVHIRLAEESDVDAIAGIYRPIVETTAVSFETVAPDDDEMRRRLGETLASYPWLVCDLDGRIAGYAYATRHRVRGAYQWSVDTSVYVHAADRRVGVGRGLYVSLFSILAAQGYFNAYAGIALPNTASVALHESVGFEKVGVYHHVGYKLGSWHDVGWWQLILKEHEESPTTPLDLATVRGHDGWEALLARGESAIRAQAA